VWREAVVGAMWYLMKDCIEVPMLQGLWYYATKNVMHITISCFNYKLVTLDTDKLKSQWLRSA